MNRIFGTASKSDAASPFERCSAWLRSRSLEPVSFSDAGPTRLGHVADGSVLGTARDGDLVVTFLGHLSKPLPDWPEERSPLDEPDRAAAYLLRRYRADGERFLDGVNGHYAVAVSDPEASRLLLARDPHGMRRLFWWRDGDTALFATRLADFRGLLGDDLEVNRAWEDFLLGYEFLPEDRTLYRGVEGLPAGRVVIWEDGAIREHTIRPGAPWREGPSDEELAELSATDREEVVIDTLGDTFMRSLEDLVPDGETVGVLLGGFDSALVVSALVQLGKKVESFSFQYADDSFNQAYVEELAGRLGTRHNWVPITADVMRDGLEHFAERFNQPVCQPHYVIASAHAMRAARERGIEHCLSGDGCDGLFLGYPTVHQRAVLIQTLSRVAPNLLPRLQPLARSGLLERQLGQPYRVARNVLRLLSRPMPARAHIAACTLDDFSLAQLRRGPAPTPAEPIEDVLRRLAEAHAGMSEVRLAYKGKSAVGLNRNKLEGGTAYAGVTVHSPFLHPGMKKLAAALPESMNRPDRATKSEATGKYALMKMAEQREMLPPEMIYQAKRSPVTAPVDRWYMGELKPFMLDRLRHLPFDYDRGYAESLLSFKVAEEAFRRHVGISRYAFNAVSLLVAYASFCELAGH